MNSNLLIEKTTAHKKEYLHKKSLTILHSDVGSHQGEGLVNLHKHILTMLDLNAQTTEHCTDVFVIVIGLLEELIKFTKFFDDQLVISPISLPLLQLSSDNAMNF